MRQVEVLLQAASMASCRRCCNMLEKYAQLGAWQDWAGQSRNKCSRAGQGRAEQGRAGQGRAGQGRAGQGRAGQGRAGQGRAGTLTMFTYLQLPVK